MQWMQDRTFDELCITNMYHITKEPIKTSHEMIPQS